MNVAAGSPNPNNPPPSRYQPLVWVALAVAAGILLDDTLSQHVPLGLTGNFATLWCATGLLLLAAFVAIAQQRALTANLTTLGSVALLAATWHHASWSLFASSDLGFFASSQSVPVALEGLLAQAPRRLPARASSLPGPGSAPPRSQCTLLVRQVRDGATWRPASGRTLVTVEGALPNWNAGDELRIFGALRQPGATMNPGTRNWAALLRADRVLSRVFVDQPACVQLRSRARAYSFQHALAALRRQGEAQLFRRLSATRAALATALLLGQREHVERERVLPFVLSGTVHMLAVSGMHLVMLVGGLFWAARHGWLPRRPGLLLTIAAAVAYALVTGAEAPIMRSMVMLSVVCAGLLTLRPARSFNSLAAAALLVLAYQPRDLFSPGAQLSFLCVATLIAVAQRRDLTPPHDPLQRLIDATRPAWQRVLARSAQGTRSLLYASTAVWLVTLPLVMARFHNVPWLAIALNILLWPVVLVAMLSGFLLLVVGWVPGLGTLLAAVCSLSLAILEATVSHAAAWDWGHAWVPGPGTWWLVGGYALLALAYALPPHRLGSRRGGMLLAGWILLGLAPSLWHELLARRHALPLQAVVLSVGHGTAVVLEFPNGQVLLYDAGQLGAPDRAAEAVASCLWQRGHRRIDSLLISHADADHYNAVPELLRRFHVGRVLVSPRMFAEPHPGLIELQADLASRDIPIQPLHAGQSLDLDPTVEVLVRHPPAAGVDGSDNANSLVLELRHAGRGLLLTGDLESPGLEQVLQQPPPTSCDLLLVPHHGSTRSDPPGFAAWCRPREAVLSGADPRAASTAVADAYRQAGARVWHTARHGAITAEIQAGNIRVASFLP